MTEDLPKKKGRGRPRKLATDANGIAAAALKELGESGTRKERRGRPRKNKVAQSMATKDDEFVPAESGEEDEDIGDSVIDEELMRKPKKSKITNIGKKPVVSTLERKCRIIRSSKDLSSARDKIERIYGLNKDKLLGLAKIKQGFEACMFDFPEADIQPDSIYWLGTCKACQKSVTKEETKIVEKMILSEDKSEFEDMSDEQYRALFKIDVNAIDISIANTGFTLSAGQRSEFPVLPDYQRHGFVFNTGAFVTDMAWLPKRKNSEEQYLAVALSQYNQSASDYHLRMFERETHISCIHIYEFNPESLNFKKQYDIIHSFGEIWDLKWHEGVDVLQSNLGLLMFASQSGYVKGLLLPHSIKGKKVLCKRASIDIGMANNDITTFDFLSVGRIICGFKNGYVAEFDLSDTKNYMAPSFYSQVHSSYITTIVVAHSTYESEVVGTLSVDGYFYLFNPKDIFTTKTTVIRFRGGNLFPAVYIPQLYAFIFADGANCLRNVVPRAAFSTQTVSSTETNISAIASSVLHPMVLYGTSSGSLYVTNAARKLLTGTKNGTAGGRALRLWQWDYNPQTGSYRLDQNYRVDDTNGSEMTRMEIDAPGVNISCVKWNETPETGKFYCFANSAGLITVERIGEQ